MATIKEIGKNKIQIKFEIPESLFKTASDQAYNKNKGKFVVPGFRKGHVPRTVLENYYGEGVFFEDTFNIAFPDAYSAAIKEQNLFVVSRPENVNLVSMEKGEPIVVTADVFVKPEVQLGEYKGMEVEYAPVAFSEKAVEEDIRATRERNARYEDVKRPAADGDRVILDYTGSVDGKAFEGGTAEAQTLNLGSGTFIPGFEKQVVGLSAGESKRLDVTFPEDYHEKNLAGKLAVFNVKITSVKEKLLPEPDDEFAQDVSEFDTFDEYKKDLTEKLRQKNEEQNNMRLESAVIEAVVKASAVDIPEPMIDSQVESQLQEMTYNLAYQGVTLDKYLEYVGSTMDELKKQLRPGASQRVKTQLVLEAVKEKENIQPAAEDVEKMMAEFAEMQKKTIEEYKAAIDPEEKDYIENRAAYQALGRFLVSQAKTIAPKPAEPAQAQEAATEATAGEGPAKEETPAEASEEAENAGQEA